MFHGLQKKNSYIDTPQPNSRWHPAVLKRKCYSLTLLEGSRLKNVRTPYTGTTSSFKRSPSLRGSPEATREGLRPLPPTPGRSCCRRASGDAPETVLKSASERFPGRVLRTQDSRQGTVPSGFGTRETLRSAFGASSVTRDRLRWRIPTSGRSCTAPVEQT